VVFYTNSSEAERVDKELTLIAELNGDLTEGTSIIEPDITVGVSLSSLSSANYLFIPSFNRYYYIRDITSERLGITRLTCKVDVLMSFKSYIRNNRGIISTQSNVWNLYLNDGSLHCYQNPMIITKRFPNGFNDQQFVLSVAGS
jgi:hypothetical protein